MGHSDSGKGPATAAEQFDRHEKRKDGARVAGGLAEGLNILRDSLTRRLHQDVERFVGKDSMLMPVSEVRTLRLTAHEIEAFQIAESTATARQFSYVAEAEQWYLPWLVRLRLGEGSEATDVAQRSRAYLAQGADRRRLLFADKLARVLPEAGRAPLVLFRLVPLAVGIATATAFADSATATKMRREQVAVLPAIADCPACHGKALPCAEQCDKCGNPLWTYEWLTTAD